MRKLIFTLASLLIIGLAMPTEVQAQKRKSKRRPTTTATMTDNRVKGTFVKKTADYVIDAVLDLTDPTVQSPWSDEKCYGYFELSNARGVHGFEVIEVQLTESGATLITVISDYAASAGLSDAEKYESSEMVSVKYNAATKTLSLNPAGSRGDSFFRNLKLKRTK